MSLLNPALLAGLGLAVIPVLLHLLLRAKPKRLIFPALRLILQRRRQNVRRMQLRHLWLLLLRVAVIALIVVAVCRPSLPAANYSLSWLEWGTLFGIVTLALGTYFGVMFWWQRQKISRAILLTRRTMLRGGIGAIAVLLALTAVAWPYVRRVSAEIKNPAPRVAENVPVAAVFLFDNSASMFYKQANKTRLRAAQEMAKAHLSHFPGGSKVAVAATSETMPAAFSTDLVAAQTRIDALEVNAASQPLNDRLSALLQVQEEDRRRVTNEQAAIPEDKRQDRFVREIYIFTDLAKSAWRDESSNLLRDELQRLRWIGIYLIDVGESAPINVALTDLKLSREAVPAKTAVRVEATVSATGQVKPDQSVELYLRAGDTPPERIRPEPVKVEPGNEARVAFYPIEILVPPYVQGELRLAGSDPLTVDDVVYFSVQTIPSLKILVVAERPAISYFWTTALKILTEAGVSAFQTELATPEQLIDRDLTGFDVVCLINASKPSDAAWNRLRTFVERGGGLAVFLGAGSLAVFDSPERIDPVRYQSSAAMSVLPAKPIAQSRHSPEKTIDVRQSKQSLLNRFEEVGALAQLGATQIRRYWKVEPVGEALVIARYAGVKDEESEAPAIIERRLGQGRVIMMTTGVDGIEWNDLPSLDDWLYLVFVDQVTQYLASQASATFNHVVGDEVRLPLDRDHKLTKVILRMPDFKQRVIDIPGESQALTFRDLTALGSYTVDSADRAVDYHMGFSLNLRAAESDLTRLETADLDGLLGEGRYRTAKDPDSLEREVGIGRLGLEIYSMIVAFLVAIFALEQFTATWFYRTDDA